jgi:uncharacterized tellurite resistance protein B-like protein
VIFWLSWNVMATDRQVALVKVLAAAAWADGRLDREEVNRIKERMLAFSLGPEELRDVDSLLAAPVSYARCEELTRDLLGMLHTKNDRLSVLQEIEALLGADGTISSDEREVLEGLRGVMEAMSQVDQVLVRMSGVFRRVFGGRKAGAPPGDLALYLKNSALQRLDDISRGAWRETIDAETLNRHMLFGAILGAVAGAEGGISESEIERIRSILEERLGWTSPLLDWAVQAVREASTGHLDRQGLLSEFNRVADAEERMTLLDAAFAVAAADGVVNGPELEELRLISNYLWLSPREFHQIRLRWAPVSGQG